MSNWLQTTFNISSVLANLFGAKTTGKTFSKGRDVLKKAANTTSSITALSNQSTILSRVFVDEAILNEPSLANFLRTCHEWYAAQIIAALHLNQLITDGISVQDILTPVQTGYNKRATSVVANIRNRQLATESFLVNYIGMQQADQMIGLEAYGKFDPKSLPSNPLAKAAGNGPKEEPYGLDSLRSRGVSENRLGPIGELFEIKLSKPKTDAKDPDNSIIIPLFIQMMPTIIPESIAPRFIDMNVDENLWQRWTKMRAGEISFWKDFVLQRDVLKRHKAIIKDPTIAKAFGDFLKSVEAKDKYALGDLTDSLNASQSYNLANSVMIFSEDTVMRAKVDSAIDLHKEADRTHYFKNTYSMILAIVDPIHQRIQVYFNGLEGGLNASYNDFKGKDQKFDPKDFMVALQAFSSNNISRLR